MAGKRLFLNIRGKRRSCRTTGTAIANYEVAMKQIGCDERRKAIHAPHTIGSRFSRSRETDANQGRKKVMRTRLFIVGVFLSLAVMLASSGMAQIRMQQRGAGQQPAAHAAANTEILTLAGTVTAVNLAAGQGMPFITLLSNQGEVTIMIGPYRLLMDQKFEIKQNQVLEVKAFQDPRMPNTFAATELKDYGTGATVVLRSAAGMPQAGRGSMGMMRGGGMRGMGNAGGGTMHGMGGGMMNGTGACADCANLDLKGKTTLEGTVQAVSMAAGQGFPNVTLLVGNNPQTIMTGPYRALQQDDFKISVGDRLSLVAYPSLQHENTFVAAAIDNLTAQKSIKLRDESGVPLGMQGRGPMKGGRR
jgi:hypothetical protein